MSDSAPRGGQQVVPRPTVWNRLMSPPWNVDAEAITSTQRIAEVVDIEGLPIQPAFDGARRAAVLVALAPGSRGVEVLLTRR